jgi:hypothetical protein
VIDHRVEQPPRQRGWIALRRPTAVGAIGTTARRRGARWALERIVWIALLPIYVVLAAFLTIGYAIAVLIVAVRSRLRRGQDSR